MGGPHDTSLTSLAHKLDHRFAQPDLLIEALTHPSAAGGHRQSYGRLEFLGDRVLGLAVAEMLLTAFPSENEGDIARRYTALVRREALTEVATRIDLGRYLRMSKGEADAGTRASASILADAMEAVIAALYLDGGWPVASQFIKQRWHDLMAEEATPPRDAKTVLQEWAQQQGLKLPDYVELGRDGPPHEPCFTVAVAVEGQASMRAQGSSKRAAEQAAAEALLLRLGVWPVG